jgi:hypothetical protein
MRSIGFPSNRLVECGAQFSGTAWVGRMSDPLVGMAYPRPPLYPAVHTDREPYGRSDSSHRDQFCIDPASSVHMHHAARASPLRIAPTGAAVLRGGSPR